MAESVLWYECMSFSMLQSQDKKSSVGSVVMDPNTKRQVSVTVPGQNKPKPTVSGRPTVKADLVSVCVGGWVRVVRTCRFV